MDDTQRTVPGLWGGNRGERIAEQAGIIPTWVARDSEWASTMLLLCSHVLREKDCLRCVDYTRGTIDWERLALWARAWSHGEQLILQLAHELYNGDDHAHISDLVSVLDNGSFELAMRAIRVRRGELEPRVV